MSALLFILVAAIMAISIRKNQNVQGIIVETIEHKICQLADDTTIFAKNLESVSILVSILENFEKCSGLKLNMEKTKSNTHWNK